MYFGRKLKQYREKRGWTQKQLAEELKTSQSAINLYELGKRRPRIHTLARFAILFRLEDFELADFVYSTMYSVPDMRDDASRDIYREACCDLCSEYRECSIPEARLGSRTDPKDSRYPLSEPEISQYRVSSYREQYTKEKYAKEPYASGGYASDRVVYNAEKRDARISGAVELLSNALSEEDQDFVVRLIFSLNRKARGLKWNF